MNADIQHLIELIHKEMKDIERSLRRAEEALVRAKRNSDDYYLDSVALNLHGFYNGLERIFEKIALVIDDQTPSGEHWHKTLLKQMSTERPDIRPAIISEETRMGLDEYRGFRHVIRNIYTFNVSPEKVSSLVADGAPLFSQIEAELIAFTQFLKR